MIVLLGKKNMASGSQCIRKWVEYGQVDLKLGRCWLYFSYVLAVAARLIYIYRSNMDGK